MIKLINIRPDEFVKNIKKLFFVALMQMIIGVGTEITNLYILCQEKTIFNTILNFVGLLTISSLDNMYYFSISSPLKKRMEKDPPRFLKILPSWNLDLEDFLN
jgi:hypothetical protein